MQRTPNYNLLQYQTGDKFLKEDLNDSLSKIDTAIGDMQTVINNADVSMLSNEIVTARKGEASLGDKIDIIDTDLAERKTYVTPEMFEAVGDGIADDSIPVQNATNYLASIGGGTLQFSKIYKCNAHMVIKDKVEWVGMGTNATILCDNGFTGTSEGWIENDGFSTTFSNPISFAIRNLTLKRLNNITTPSKTALRIANVSGVTIDKCKFVNDVVYTDPNTETTNLDLYACWENVKVTNCEFSNISDTTAGGNMWVRNFSTTYTANNAKILNCNMTKKTHDECICVFNCGGDIDNVTIEGNKIHMLASTSVSPIALSINASTSGKTISNVKLINNKVDIDDFSYIALRLNEGAGTIKNINVERNNFTVATSTASSNNVFLIRNTGTQQNVSILNNIFNVIGSNEIKNGIQIAAKVNDNIIMGGIQYAILSADEVNRNNISTTSTSSTGIQNCNNVNFNTITNFKNAIVYSNAVNTNCCNNKISLPDINLSTAFMFQNLNSSYPLIKAYVNGNFITVINTGSRFISLDDNPTNCQVTFTNNTFDTVISSYAQNNTTKLRYARNNIIGTISDTYGGIPNSRIRDILPIGHESRNANTLYIKTTTANNSDADWKTVVQ